MKDVYRTIGSYGENQIVINKSKFIGYSMPINTEDEAKEFINQIKTKHRDATHNVYAYVVGEDSNIQRFSDDGEPSGTAGIPALEVLKKEDLRNVVVVITRYFGGVKLGGGGLIRAYTRGAKIAIDAGVILDMVLHLGLNLILDYTLYGKVENFLNNGNYKIEEVIYEENVQVFMYIIKSKVDEFTSEIVNLTSGSVYIECIDEIHLPILNSKRF